MESLLNGRYRILKQLGLGGLSKVFLALDTLHTDARQCVVKQFHPNAINQLEDKSDLLEYFKKEAAILERLSKQTNQIPKLYGEFEKDGEYYIVLEYIDGETLKDKVRREGAFKEPDVKKFLLDFLEVLIVIHSEVIHRDINPNNIILRQDGRAFLIDFGTVKENKKKTILHNYSIDTSTHIGTPGYMSPEQKASKAVYPSSDIYGLGMTAIYLLSGKEPSTFHNSGRGKVFWQKHCPQVNTKFAKFLDKAVEFQPSNRFQSAREMLEELRSLTMIKVPRTSRAVVIDLPTNAGKKPDQAIPKKQPDTPIDPAVTHSKVNDISDTPFANSLKWLDSVNPIALSVLGLILLMGIIGMGMSLIFNERLPSTTPQAEVKSPAKVESPKVAPSSSPLSNSNMEEKNPPIKPSENSDENQLEEEAREYREEAIKISVSDLTAPSAVFKKIDKGRINYQQDVADAFKESSVNWTLLLADMKKEEGEDIVLLKETLDSEDGRFNLTIRCVVNTSTRNKLVFKPNGTRIKVIGTILSIPDVLSKKPNVTINLEDDASLDVLPDITKKPNTPPNINVMREIKGKVSDGTIRWELLSSQKGNEETGIVITIPRTLHTLTPDALMQVFRDSDKKWLLSISSSGYWLINLDELKMRFDLEASWLNKNIKLHPQIRANDYFLLLTPDLTKP